MLLLAALDNDEARMTDDEGMTNREWRIHVVSDWVCAFGRGVFCPEAARKSLRIDQRKRGIGNRRAFSILNHAHRPIHAENAGGPASGAGPRVATE